MKEYNYEKFNSLKTEDFLKFCEDLYNCLIDSKEQYFSQDELDDFFEKNNIYYKGKYATIYKEERLFEKGYNKNTLKVLNLFFNLYDKYLQVFILNGNSLIEILPNKKVKPKKIRKKLFKLKEEKVKEIITRTITTTRLQR